MKNKLFVQRGSFSIPALIFKTLCPFHLVAAGTSTGKCKDEENNAYLARRRPESHVDKLRSGKGQLPEAAQLGIFTPPIPCCDGAIQVSNPTRRKEHIV